MSQVQRPVWAEIDKRAIVRNYLQCVRRAGPHRRVIVAIKADAYGHGSVAIAKALDPHGVFAYWTGNVPEAIELRGAGIRTKIIMFGGYLPDAMPQLVEHDLTPTIYDADGMAAAVRAARGRVVPVYVKVDSGLGRLGIPLASAREFIRAVAARPSIRLEGIYSHLPFRDRKGRDWALARATEFEQLLAELAADGIEPETTQLWGSAGLIAGLPDVTSAVCIGYLLYGLPPVSDDVANIDGYDTAFSAIKARMIHVGQHGVSEAPDMASRYRMSGATQTGAIAFGSGDGMRSPLAGQTIKVLVRGRRAPVIGVSLEHTVLDLSGIDSPRVGDEVVLLGAAGGERITSADWAVWLGCSPLDVIVGVSGRIRRRYVSGPANPP